MKSSLVAQGISDLYEVIEDRSVREALKRLESFLQECEMFGIYDERKSLPQLRRELDRAKSTRRGYLQ